MRETFLKLIAVAVVASLGCRTPPSEASGSPVPSMGSAQAPVALPVTSVGSATEAPADAIGTCAAVMQSSIDQAKRGAQPGERVVSNSDIQHACAPIYKEATCRSAVEHAADASSPAASSAAFDTCRDVYCPKLASPKPAACSSTTVAASEWGELFKAIVQHDHGDAAKPILDGIDHGRVTTRVR